jgi:hypothetical protein
MIKAKTLDPGLRRDAEVLPGFPVFEIRGSMESGTDSSPWLVRAVDRLRGFTRRSLRHGHSGAVRRPESGIG